MLKMFKIIRGISTGGWWMNRVNGWRNFGTWTKAKGIWVVKSVLVEWSIREFWSNVENGFWMKRVAREKCNYVARA